MFAVVCYFNDVQKWKSNTCKLTLSSGNVGCCLGLLCLFKNKTKMLSANAGLPFFT